MLKGHEKYIILKLWGKKDYLIIKKHFIRPICNMLNK